MVYFTMVSYDRVDGGVWHLSPQQVVQSLLYTIFYIFCLHGILYHGFL